MELLEYDEYIETLSPEVSQVFVIGLFVLAALLFFFYCIDNIKRNKKGRRRCQYDQ